MKHLKKFNEELNPEEQDSLEKIFLKAKISPQVDKVNIKSIYNVLFIQVDGQGGYVPQGQTACGECGWQR